MKVLIYLPVYNDQFRISRAIESIVSQTFTNWDLVISDNCSTDKTLAEIQYYLKDPRISCITHQTHLSGDVNFNNIENFISNESEHELTSIIASDDYWGDEYYLENLVGAFLKNSKEGRIKLALPIFSTIPNIDTGESKLVKIKAGNSLYILRVIQLFKSWSTVNLIYGLYSKEFFLDLLNTKFSRLTKSNAYTDWWWAYLVLKKTSPLFCCKSIYFKDQYKYEIQKKFSRIENFILTIKFTPDFFKGKLSLIRFNNFHDLLLIFIFAISKTTLGLLHTFRRTLKRIFKV